MWLSLLRGIIAWLVFPIVSAQMQLLDAIAAGWEPCIPIDRGVGHLVLPSSACDTCAPALLRLWLLLAVCRTVSQCLLFARAMNLL